MPSEDKIQFAFTAGEVSDFFLNRSDLNKYDLGLLQCENFFVDPRGGITSRPGSRYIGPVLNNDEQLKMFRFRGAGGGLPPALWGSVHSCGCAQSVYHRAAPDRLYHLRRESCSGDSP